MIARIRRSLGDDPSRQGHAFLAAVAVVAGLVLAESPADAQSPLYLLEMPDLLGAQGGDVTAILTLDNASGLQVSGITVGVCSDPLLVVPVVVQEGATTAALNGGNGPDFFNAQIAAAGVGVAVVTAFGGGAGFPPAAGHQIFDVRYSLIGSPGSVTPLDICDTLVFPPVVNPIVASVIAGGIITPTVIDGSIEIGAIPSAALEIDAPAIGIPGASVIANVRLDNTEPILGFRFGLSYPASSLELTSVDPTGLLAQTQGGSGPALFLVDFAPTGGSGATIECTISNPPFLEALPIGTDQPILDLEFEVLPSAGPPCAVVPLGFTDTLGVPAVPIEVTLISGPAPAASAPGGIVLGPAPAPSPPSGGITLLADTQTAFPGESVTSRVSLDSDTPIEAFSFGIAYVPGDVTLLAIGQGLHIAQLRCGQGPEFFAATIHSGAAAGATVGAVFALQPPLVDATLGAGGGQELVLLEFATSTNPVSGGSALTFTDSLGTPPVALEVTVGAMAVVPATLDGAIALAQVFTRGDTNDDGDVDIADPIRLLGALFPGAGGATPLACLDAGDTNDDGQVNIADAVTLLSALFGGAGGGIQPPLSCGIDPSSDSLGCDLYTACP